jgi:hypothetical protein
MPYASKVTFLKIFDAPDINHAEKVLRPFASPCNHEKISNENDQRISICRSARFMPSFLNQLF